jgi:uncharacterized membrane protein YidH (DUF202 family)
MKTEKSVETYLKWIRRNLHGIERDSIDSIVEELEGHINEKAADRAEEKGLKKPDEAIYLSVLEELGPPEEVAIDYLKILPKKPSIILKAFMGVQFALGLIALLIGVDLFYLAGDFIATNGNIDNYPLVQVIAGLVFVIIGIATMALVYLQYKKPSLIVHYQSGSAMLSLTLAAGILFVMLNYLIWRYLNKDFNYEESTAIAMPVFLALTLAYILGLRSTEEFQRRIALEEIDNKLFEQKRASSRNAMVALAVVSLFLVSAAGAAMFTYNVQTFNETSLVSTDHVGGKYDASIEHWRTYNTDMGRFIGDDMVVYTVNGTRHEGYLHLEIMGALDYISNSTEPNAVIMCWWDYGHAVRGLTGRDTVIANPSKNMMDTIAKPSSIKEWDDQTKVEKVGKAFAAENVSTTISMMNETGARYLFTDSRDAQGIAYAFFRAAGQDPDLYLKNVQPSNPYMDPLPAQPTAKGRQTTIFKIWQGNDLPGLKLVYSDTYTRIYKIA